MDVKTKLIRSGKYTTCPKGIEYKTLNPPIYKGSTILLSYKDFKTSKPPFHGNYYGTLGNPAQLALEDAICELENGYMTRACPSGLNAITTTFMALCSQGDHILVCDNVYAPTMNFCNNVLSKYGVKVDALPPDTGKNITDYIKPNTRLIFLESPGSNTFEIQDIEPIIKIAKEKNIVTIIDNTWATPLFFRPLDYGIDISIMSGTKYIGGHSDILLGTITTNEAYSNVISKFYETVEIFVNSEDCYLGLRGLRTLNVRLKYQEEAALNIARWLEAQDIIETVIHPALPSHPQHELFNKYFTESSGVFGFTFKENYNEEQIEKFMNSLEFFPVGLSWGGVNSLIKSEVYTKRKYLSEKFKNKTVFRLSIGLEDVEDLKNDLLNGFKALS
ncbi:MAG: cystathionine beta-lyase [Candidatus Melainabacteria bacterium GWF2_37_15]|nr:MAG: cystathionine beta-lyase [Candidatus Melainabacteria bacterium GWF2_37_15]